MNGFFRKYQNLIILSALLTVTLYLLVGSLRNKQSLNFFENAALTILAPFQDAVGWSAASSIMVWDNYINLVGVREENKFLQELVDKLAFENGILVERLQSYQRVERLLKFPRLDKIPFEAVRVIGRDTTDRAKILILNKGAANGLAVNMPVVTYRGVVGRIVAVSYSASKALLITDVRSAMDAVVQNSRDKLVVVGTNTSMLETRYLEVNSSAKDGDVVISSGLGGVFPKGLVIGVLRNIGSESGSLFLSANLEPSEDLSRIEEALVLKGPPPEM